MGGARAHTAHWTFDRGAHAHACLRSAREGRRGATCAQARMRDSGEHITPERQIVGRTHNLCLRSAREGRRWGARHNTPHYSRCSDYPDEPLVRARCASAGVGESEWRMAAAGAPTGSELAREKTLNFTRFKLWDGQRLRESVKEWRREENNTHRNESECTKSWLNACHCRVYIPQRPVVAGERGRFVTSPSVMISAPRKERS